MRTPSHRVLIVVALLVTSACAPEPQQTWLGTPDQVAPGVELDRSTDPTLTEPAAPISAYLLRLNPEQVRIESALANDSILGAELVQAIAERHGAVAAVNGGFFDDIGEPTGLLVVAGELVSDTGALKGAVIIRSPPDGRTELAFDRLAARMSLTYEAEGQQWTVPVDGVDTTRARGGLMLYTPTYHADTDTAPNGTEWILGDDPLRVLEVRSDEGRAPIPRDGVALSYGGLSVPNDLIALTPGIEVTFETRWQAVNAESTERLEQADHVIGGAGLLKHDGVEVADWNAEGLPIEGFTDARNPRTLIGVDRRGFVWLVAVDGRQPSRSVGMTFSDLQRLSERLQLTDALNLDGGGSTTMVVDGQVVNRPSNVGPRAVSDAILVTLR